MSCSLRFKGKEVISAGWEKKWPRDIPEQAPLLRHSHEDESGSSSLLKTRNGAVFILKKANHAGEGGEKRRKPEDKQWWKTGEGEVEKNLPHEVGRNDKKGGGLLYGETEKKNAAGGLEVTRGEELNQITEK